MVKNLYANARDMRDARGSVPGLARSPGVRSSNPLQYSSLENPMDRGAWQATVHAAAWSQTQLSTYTHVQCANTRTLLGATNSYYSIVLLFLECHVVRIIASNIFRLTSFALRFLQILLWLDISFLLSAEL